MNWKYYIPTEMSADERVTWQDIWLLPENVRASESVWLTVDGFVSAKEFLDEEQTSRLTISSQFFLIDETDIVVKADDFNRAEILFWTKVWLLENNFSVSRLDEGTFEEFQNTNTDARAIAEAKTLLPSLLSEIEKAA